MVDTRSQDMDPAQVLTAFDESRQPGSTSSGTEEGVSHYAVLTGYICVRQNECLNTRREALQLVDQAGHFCL
ncbi:MAG: hypothetical protein KDI16_03565 [Halioglobus sp.]|nr:hypothetical protein [Halioglobus sp.]